MLECSPRAITSLDGTTLSVSISALWEAFFILMLHLELGEKVHNRRLLERYLKKLTSNNLYCDTTKYSYIILMCWNHLLCMKIWYLGLFETFNLYFLYSMFYGWSGFSTGLHLKNRKNYSIPINCFSYPNSLLLLLIFFISKLWRCIDWMIVRYLLWAKSKCIKCRKVQSKQIRD